MASQQPSRETRRTHLVIDLRTIALAGAVLGIASLGTLVVVASLKNVDALATVALALAIIAFVVQLIVFIVQAAAANQQAVRAEELHGSMKEVLAEMREKLAGTHEAVSAINERMLTAILAKYLADVPGATAQTAEAMAGQIAPTLEAMTTRTGDRSRDVPAFPARRPVPEDAAIVHQLRTFPAAGREQERALDALRSLDVVSRHRLTQFGEDELRSRLLDEAGAYDPGLTDNLSSQLLARGLVAPVEEPDQRCGGRQVLQLTPLGREVARLLTAPGKPPAYLATVPPLRPSADFEPTAEQIEELTPGVTPT